MNADDTLLRWSLRGNAAFSAVSGAVAVFWAGPLTAWMGVGPAGLVPAIGAVLWGFAAALLWLASREPVPVPLAWAVVAADLGWVLATLPVVLSDALSRSGDWLAVAVADAVLLFAVLQAVGARRATAVCDSRQPV